MLCPFSGEPCNNPKVQIVISGKKVNCCQTCISKFQNWNQFIQNILTNLNLLSPDLVINKIKNIKDLNEYVNALLPSQDVKLQCSQCGISLQEVITHGTMGCAQCYEDFKKVITPIINQIHNSTKHCGKKPKSGKYHTIDIKELEKQMAEMVKQEKYEEAALIRDRIRQLRLRLESN